jgi:amidase
MATNDLYQLDASATAAAIRAGRISSREVTEAALARMDAVNPAINAVVHRFDEESLAAADAADRALRQGLSLGPLHGVPVTTKIDTDLAGHAATTGLVSMKDARVAEDGIPTANLRKAGAVIIGQTNVPAFCYRWFASNDLHGITRNPHDLTRSPGGSSGGAAASVAAGIGALAHGNDVAGSLRLPGSVCGVYAMKGTMGLIPSYNPSQTGESTIGLQLGASEGVITRSVRDLRLGMSVLAQFDPRDPDQVPAPPVTPAQRLPCRVAMWLGDGDTPVDPEVAAVTRQAAGWLSDAGYVVEEVAPPHLSEMAELWMALLYADASDPVRAVFMELGDEAFRRSFQFTADSLPKLDQNAHTQGWVRRMEIRRAWAAFFHTYPIVLTPTACVPPLPVDHDTVDKETMGRIIRAYRPLPLVAGLGVPGLNVPAGMVNGLPVGVQIIARWFEDERCLSVAEVMERRIGPLLPVNPNNQRQR